MSFSFKNLFSGSSSSSSVVGIDIGSSAIKIVEIKKVAGKAMLETYGSISLGPYGGTEVGTLTSLPPEKLSEALNEVIKQSAVTTTSAVVAIPVQSSLIFTIELPTQIKESDMKSVVETEARRYIPVPITEVSLDYFMLPKKEDSFEGVENTSSVAKKEEKLEFLVVAIQNDAVTKYRSVVAESKLNASFFEIEIFSSVRSNFEHELSLVLLMDFGASRTKLSLVEFGIVKSYHTVNRGGADITNAISKSLSIPFTEAEEMKKEFGLLENPKEKNIPEIAKVHIDYIFSETNNVLLAYEKKYGQTISKVIITGGGSLLKGLEETAANNFGAEIKVGHPFSKVGAPEFLEKVLKATGPEFAIAVGLALRKLQ